MRFRLTYKLSVGIQKYTDFNGFF